MRWLGEIPHDAGYAVRSLRQSPAFAIVAILTLALGIGATTAVYSIVDTILLQPLPFVESDRLVRLVENVPHVVAGRPPLQRGLNHDDLIDWQPRSRTLSDMAVVTWLGGLAQTDEGLARLTGAMVSTNLFAMLGAPPILGRTFTRSDEASPDVVVLSFDTWRRRFRADAAVVGTAIELKLPEQAPRPFTVIGVLPASFEFPTRSGADFFVPVALTDALRRYSSDLIARLAPGVSAQAATDEANAIGRTMPPRANASQLPGPRFEVEVLKERMVGALRPALRLFLAAVAVVLLIVCANVANLLLARGTARQREIAVRIAIGATRARVMRQVLTECVVLAAIGGALGVLVAVAAVSLVKDLASVEAPGMFRFALGATLLPRVNEIAIDFEMFGIAFVIAALTSVAFGVVPALHLSRTSYLQAMGTRGGGSDRGESRIRATLVVGQLVMATVLLIGAGLLIRSFVTLLSVHRGYDPTNVLAFHLVLPPDYSTAQKTETIEAILARLGAAPTVAAAGFTRAGMLIREEIFVGTFVPPGRTAEEMRTDPGRPRLRPVSPGFLTAMGVPLLHGRELVAAPAAVATPEIVISRTVARQFFDTDDAVGRVVDWHVAEGRVLQAQVVGVVDDIRNESPENEPSPEIFVEYRQLLPLLQTPGASTVRVEMTAIGLLSFAVRIRDDAASAAPLIGAIVRSVDPNAGIDAILPMERLVANSVARPRFYAVLLGIFAGLAGLLATIGIYGVLAYAVTQRTREIGIRMALGAQRGQVLGLVLGTGVRLAAIGLALGLAGAVAGTRLLQSLLFGITPLDVRTFVAVSTIFGLVAALAAYLPARNATRIEPMAALRNE